MRPMLNPVEDLDGSLLALPESTFGTSRDEVARCDAAWAMRQPRWWGPAARVGEERALSFLDLVNLTGLQLSGRGSSARNHRFAAVREPVLTRTARSLPCRNSVSFLRHLVRARPPQLMTALDSTRSIAELCSTIRNRS